MGSPCSGWTAAFKAVWSAASRASLHGRDTGNCRRSGPPDVRATSHSTRPKGIRCSAGGLERMELLHRQICEKEVEVFHGWLFDGGCRVQQDKVIELAGNALLDLVGAIILNFFSTL